MAQIVKLKRSATQGNIPLTTQLDLGEVAINTYDGKVFIKKDDGAESIVEIGTGTLLNATTDNVDYGWTVQCRLDDVDNTYGDLGRGAIDFSASNSAMSKNSNDGATGRWSFATGFAVEASGDESFACGSQTSASGGGSHAEGVSNVASGNYSHAEGLGTSAEGSSSHSAGQGTRAIGSRSHASGQQNIALNDDSFVTGSFNIGTSTETIFETGIGTSVTTRKNAFEIYLNGRVRAPELTIALHDDPSSLTTKEYVDSAAGSLALNDLTDVVITTATSGQILSLDTNGNWVNTDTVYGNLKVENGTLSTYYINALSGSGTGALKVEGNLEILSPYTILNSIDILNDVDTTTTAPQVGDILEFDGTNWVPGVRLKSDATGITGATAVTNIVQIGQADYDNLTPDPDTVYIINGA